MPQIRAGLVGVTGYSGMEMFRLLGMHPDIKLTRATSRREAGKKVRELFPYAQGLPFSELVVSEPDVGDLADNCDVVFLAVPHGAAMNLAAELLKKGLRVVDLSADFRLRDPSVYRQWYGLEHEHRELLERAVYGLPEFYSERIKKTSLVANPGCYPTSAILALAPALSREMASPEHIVVDSKSGATGAGRGAKQANLFCEVYDNFRAYNLGGHRHTPEIEQELSLLSGGEMTISFNTHLLPTNRGILSTCYMQLKKDLSQEEIVAAYEAFYRDSPWVRVLPSGTLPETRWVRGTMYCDLGLVREPRSGRLIAVSAIDNLCRGASAQAVANANLMLGLDVKTGLNLFPLLP